MSLALFLLYLVLTGDTSSEINEQMVVSIYEDGRQSGKVKLLNEVLASFQMQRSKHVHMKAG